MIYIIRIINFFIQLLTLLIIIKVLLSYFMDPYHPVRSKIDRLIDPLLTPIRRLIPPLGMLDLSPIILLLLIQLLGQLIINLLSSMGG